MVVSKHLTYFYPFAIIIMHHIAVNGNVGNVYFICIESSRKNCILEYLHKNCDKKCLKETYNFCANAKNYGNFLT